MPKSISGNEQHQLEGGIEPPKQIASGPERRQLTEGTPPPEPKALKKGKEQKQIAAGNPPVESPKKKGPEKAVVVQAEGAIEARARDMADAAMASNKGESGFWKRLWKHSMMRDYYHQRELAKARRRIKESGNLYVAEDGSQEDHKEAMAAIVDRFSSEYVELHKGREGHPEEDEWRKVLGETMHAGGAEGAPDMQLKEKINELIRAYAKGEISAQDFQEEKIRAFQRSQGKKEDVTKAAEFADNLLEIAENLKNRLAHEEGLNAEDFEIDVLIGKANAGVRTETQLRGVDRLVGLMKKTPVLNLINEETLGAAAAVAYLSSGKLALAVTRSKVAAVLTFGASAAIGGALAGWRERVQLAEERTQHAREMAEGKEFSPDAKRRSRMEEFRYNTERSDVLAERLEAALEKISGGPASPEDIQEAMSHLADIESRIQISDRQRIDLISYSDSKAVERERTRMDLLRATAKVRLRQAIAASGGNYDFDTRLSEVVKLRKDVLVGGEAGVEQKDKMFNAMRRKQVAKRAIAAALVAVAAGSVIQEVRAAFSDQLEGVVDMVRDIKEKGANQSLWRSFFGTEAEVVSGGRLPLHEWISGDGEIHAKLPEGYDLRPSGDGAFEIYKGDELVAGGLGFEEDGSLSEASKALLEENGFTLGETSAIVEEVTTKAGEVSAEDFIKEHAGQFQDIKRDLWFDNDTPKPVFDKNELRLWWGGDATHLDSSGNVVFDMSHMTPDGSYHDGLTADAQELAREGGLKLLLSLSADTQGQVFEVDISPDGKALIDPDSEIGKVMFSKFSELSPAEQAEVVALSGGKTPGAEEMIFTGKYAEVAQMMPADENGIQHTRILATHVGIGREAVAAVIEEKTENEVITNIIEANAQETVAAEPGIEVPPPVPVLPRTPLERATRKKGEVPPPAPAPKQITEGEKGPLPAVRESSSVDIMRAELRDLLGSTELMKKFLSDFERFYEERYTKEYMALCQELPPLTREKYEGEYFREMATHYGEARSILFNLSDPDQSRKMSPKERQAALQKAFSLCYKMREGLNKLRRRAKHPEQYQLGTGEAEAEPRAAIAGEAEESSGPEASGEQAAAGEEAPAEIELTYSWSERDTAKYDKFLETGVAGRSRGEMRKIIESDPKKAVGMLEYFYLHYLKAYNDAEARLKGPKLRKLKDIHERTKRGFREAKKELEELENTSKKDRRSDESQRKIGRVVGVLRDMHAGAQSYKEEIEFSERPKSAVAAEEIAAVEAEPVETEEAEGAVAEEVAGEEGPTAEPEVEAGAGVEAEADSEEAPPDPDFARWVWNLARAYERKVGGRANKKLRKLTQRMEKAANEINLESATEEELSALRETYREWKEYIAQKGRMSDLESLPAYGETEARIIRGA